MNLIELRETAKKNGQVYKVEATFEIVSINLSSQRQFVNCRKCNNREWIEDKSMFVSKCPKCGATQSDRPGATFDITAIAIIKDDTATVKLDLWRLDLVQFKPGDKVRLLNGYGRYKLDDLYLQRGKGGILEKC